MKIGARFLNVDFDLWSTQDLGSLVNGLGGSVIVIHSDVSSVSLELAEHQNSADEAFMEMARLLASSSQEVRESWQACHKRQANIGVQSGPQPHELFIHVSLQSLRLLCDLGMDVLFTTYACSMHDQRSAQDE